jgi:hypothetical protein
MKLTKMSLVAALLIGSSAFALDNVKMSGDANLVYQTSDAASGYDALKGRTDGTLFSKDSSSADASVNLNVTADLLKNDLVSISAGAGYTVLTTLGLENNFVSNVWGGAHTATAGTGGQYGAALGGAKVNTASWFNEAWVAATAGKTTAKIGRMVLDTPLAFTETWSIEKNTFDAAVVVNQDIPDTTLVGAFVGNGNGTETFGYDSTTTPATNPGANAQSNVQANGLATAPVVNGNGDFTTYGTNGAYAVGVVNNSYAPLVAQAWYYDIISSAQAYWVQGDLDVSSLGVDGLTLGGQYVNIDASDTVANSDASQTVAAKIGYAMKDMFAASLSYSQVSTKGVLGAANTATSTGQSKLYTEAWWNYGQVTKLGAKSINLTVEAPVADVADFGLYVTNVDQKTAQDLTEVTLTASKSFGAFDGTLAYINTNYAKAGTVKSTNNNTVQVYATLNF